MSQGLLTGLVIAAQLGLIGPGQVRAASAAASSAGPTQGDVIPAFDTVKVDGTVARVEFPKGSSTVLLFFMSGCPSCHRMIPEWNRAFARKSGGLTVLGVLMDQEPPGFFETLDIAFPVVRSPGRDLLRQLKITRAPTAIRIGAGGRIEDVAIGAVDGMRVGEIFRP